MAIKIYTYNICGWITGIDARLDATSSPIMKQSLYYAHATDGADKATEYSWDANGNMTCDLNKGITKIKYNHLNLPEQITHSDGHVTRLTYAADGRKLRVRYLLDPTAVISQPGEPVEAGILNAGNTAGIQSIDDFMHPGDSVPQISNPIKVLMTRDYCGNYTYLNGTAERVTLGNGFLQDSTYYVMITDYQGNVRAVLDSDCNLVERNEYYPYGGLINAGDSQLQPLKYSSKELDRQNGLDHYDSQARWYDPVVPGTTTQDPKAEDYTPLSPYTWCAGNPVRIVDPDGKDIYYFDTSGNYFSKEIKEGENRICVLTEENVLGKTITFHKFYDLADPIRDGKMIEKGYITRLEFVSEKDIQNALSHQGAFESGKMNFVAESVGGGDFDYSKSYLEEKYSNGYSMLFIPENDNMAHNLMNFGNYLWGATGYVVGFGYAELRLGAHINSLINPRRNGYPPQLDSDDDQRSIVKGIHHAQKNHYRNLKK